MRIIKFKSTLCVLLTATVLSSVTVAAYADMTDEQVVEYVKQQRSTGKTERQIGKELIANGVTKEQIERVRKKYASSETQLQAKPKVDTKVVRQAAENAPDNPTVQTVAAIESQPIELKPTSNIFGHNVFSSETLSFEPNENQATPQDYRLGPGDEVVIDIWGASEDRLRETISPEGNIIVEQLGPIYLNGMTIGEANDHIRKLFAYKYAGVEEAETDISLTLGAVRTIQVNIMGEVATPGTYRLSPFSTVFHALYRSGGITNIGTLRNIEIMRAGRRIATVDVYDYLFGGKNSQNINLQEGDVIIVPP